MAPATRERIVDAAAEVMRTLGLSRATTKAIAQQAGYSEATLYKHFDSKEELFLEVLRTRLPPLAEVLADLPAQVGAGGLRERLEHVAGHALDFYRQGTPISASLFASPALLERHRERVHELGAGPHRPAQLLAEHLAAEQEAGNLRTEVSAEAAASLLLGACFQRAFLASFTGVELTEADRGTVARELVDVLLRGIDPAGA